MNLREAQTGAIYAGAASLGVDANEHVSTKSEILGANSDIIWLSHALARILLIFCLAGTCPDSE